MFKERMKTHHSAMSEGKKYIAGMCSVSEALHQENQSDKRNATIYIHVPFCNKICSFCNMRRSLQKPEENYAATVIREIKEYAKLPYVKTTTFDAVYFGGGTPTTLDTESICAIVETLREQFTFTSDAEFSVETTVTELTDEKLDRLIKTGVNRFSVGVQTFDNAGRQKMGRIGTGEAAFEKLKQIKTYEGVTVSMDLIYNYPEQTMESLYADLDKMKALELDGFSMYSLINMRETSIDAAQDELTDEKMFFAIAGYMKKAGYHFLELTKMVKADRYRYIMNRHEGADTLPLGAGAGGSVHHFAMMNPIDLQEYYDSVAHFSQRRGMLFVPEYDNVVRFKGAIQTGKLPKESYYADQAGYQSLKQELFAQGMIEQKGDTIYLTEKGIFWGNTISRELSAMIG